jgi:gas vesicle protein
LLTLKHRRDVMEDRTSPTAALGFILAGGLVGAGVALLLAPYSGRHTRRLVGRRIRRTTNSVAQLKEKLVSMGEDLIDEASHLAEEASEFISEKLESRPSADSQAAEGRH